MRTKSQNKQIQKEYSLRKMTNLFYARIIFTLGKIVIIIDFWENDIKNMKIFLHVRID